MNHPSGHAPLAGIAAALATVDELAACRGISEMLRLAIELGRSRLGLERVGIFLRDPQGDRILMRGTWGTGAHGETTDERTLLHELTPCDHDALLGSRRAGGFGYYRPKSPLVAAERGNTVVIGEGWLMATPLVVENHVIGVMYNDAALTRSPMDDSKQAAAAVLCSMLAVLYQTRRRGAGGSPLERGSLVERARRLLAEDLQLTGERLGRKLGVSAGHLARSFKREMGASLVDYRNQLRLERFFDAVQRSGPSGKLSDAAQAAGFGSYAQFHRVYRKKLGRRPCDGIAGDSPAVLGDGGVFHPS